MNVSRTFTSKYNIEGVNKKISDIMASPTRIEIMNKLSSSDSGMSEEEIIQQISNNFLGVRSNLTKLLEEKIIEVRDNDNRYYLTEQGKSIYKDIQEIASKVQEKKILSE